MDERVGDGGVGNPATFMKSRERRAVSERESDSNRVPEFLIARGSESDSVSTTGDKGGGVSTTKRNAYTMRDIARLAGVSVSTVSAVVNNKGIVSPDLTESVQKAIKALGFRPHAGARSLRLGRSHVIGMVIQDVTNPFFVEVMRGVESEAIKSGYEIMVCNSNGQADLELRHLDALYAQRVDGILLIPSDSYAAREILVRNHGPIVFVDCVPLRAEVACVMTDNFDASREAIRYLIGLGHKRVAVISGRLVHSTNIDRVEGYRKAMQEAGLPIPGEYLKHGDSTVESGYRFGLALLQSSTPPTAIFTVNNRLSLGVLQALRELRTPCPESVSVLGFDDTDWAAVFNPALTVVAQPTDGVGKRAVELLLQSIQRSGSGAEIETRRIILKSSLRIRGSTGPPPKA
jgi:LacI family transcriptional regulator